MKCVVVANGATFDVLRVCLEPVDLGYLLWIMTSRPVRRFTHMLGADDHPTRGPRSDPVLSLVPLTSSVCPVCAAAPRKTVIEFRGEDQQERERIELAGIHRLESEDMNSCWSAVMVTPTQTWRMKSDAVVLFKGD